MDTNYETCSVSMPELEGVLVREEGGEFSPPANVLITNYSVPPIVEQPSSRNYIQTPNGARLN